MSYLRPGAHRKSLAGPTQDPGRSVVSEVIDETICRALPRSMLFRGADDISGGAKESRWVLEDRACDLPRRLRQRQGDGGNMKVGRKRVINGVEDDSVGRLSEEHQRRRSETTVDCRQRRITVRSHIAECLPSASITSTFRNSRATGTEIGGCPDSQPGLDRTLSLPDFISGE